MPLYDLACSECGARKEEFCHASADKGVATHVCHCGGTMTYLLSMGIGLTWFEEGRGRWITNLGVEPVYVTSHRQHQQLMKERGVEWATPFRTQGTKGWV